MKREYEIVYNTFFIKHNFQKKGMSYIKHTNKFLIVFKLRKSNWTEDIYINLGVYFKHSNQVSKLKFTPKIEECHLNCELRNLFKALDSREINFNKLNFILKNEQVFEYIERLVFPFIDKLEDSKFLESIYKSYVPTIFWSSITNIEFEEWIKKVD